MIEPYLVGLAGLVLLVIAWTPETIRTIRERHAPIELKFSVAYAIGSICLMTYAYLLNDWIFTLLNLATTIMALLNAYFKVIEKNMRSKANKTKKERR